MKKRSKATAAANAGAAAAKTATKKASKRGYNPRALNDLATVCANVSASWALNPLITLIWITQAQFAAIVAVYLKMLAAQQGTASDRPTQTQSLNVLDKSINAGVTQVKINIAAKFKKANAEAQFARYGIVKKGSSYIMSRDRDDRVAALKLMVAAIAADGFGADPDYGTDFWTTMQTNYILGIAAASNTDETVSGGSGNIKSQVAQINKIMTALRNVIKGNYPDNTAAVYRNWGWLRRDY